MISEPGKLSRKKKEAGKLRNDYRTN